MAIRFPASSARFRKTPRRLPSRRSGSRPGSGQGTFAVTRRPAAPAYWRNIAPVLRKQKLPESPMADKDRMRYWRLVLEAKAIPFRFFERGPRPSLYVPPLAEPAALHEITAFEREKPPLPPPSPPERRGVYWYAALLAVLIPWHRVRWNNLLAFDLWPAAPKDWLTIAGLDAYRVATLHEWWRSATALTLHADGAHLISNVVMGAVFGIPLCRYTGVGLGFFLTVLAGCIGNVATAYLRPASFLSQGFSTAVFASAGLLAAFAAAFAARHVYAMSRAAAKAAHRKAPRKDAVKQGLLKGLPPIGAGLGFLAMLGGSDAPNVDYLAHTMGLLAGTLLGLAVALPALPRFSPESPGNLLLQGISLFAAAMIFIGAWGMALG